MNREQGVKLMSVRLLALEQYREQTRAIGRSCAGLSPRFDQLIELALEQLDIEIESLAYCLKRDRINNRKPR